MSEVQEWISVERTTKGVTSVKVTLVDGHFAAKWAVKTFGRHIKETVAEARKAAATGLAELKEAADG